MSFAEVTDSKQKHQMLIEKDGHRGQKRIYTGGEAHQYEIQALAETERCRQTATGVRSAATLRNETDVLV